jgi:putative membrane protein
MRYWNDNWLCGPGGYFHGPWGMLVNLAFWILVVFLIVWVFRSLFGHKGPDSAPALSALDVLQQRYAAGEIEREEYERIKKELQG